MHHISKSFTHFQAIKNISLTIHKGEIYGIIGASGAGKSTLLRLMNAVEKPDQGEVIFDGESFANMSHPQLRQARKSIGMIFQHFNLVANKTVYANVAVALELAGYPRQERRERVLECLRFVGLDSMVDKYPATLSGGQKQRVAIARAIANHPKLLLCDEPTSALDPSTAAEILAVLENINKSFGVTIVLVSHQMNVIKSLCNRVAIMADGEMYDTISIEPTGVTLLDHTIESLVQQLTRGGGRVDT